MRENQEPFTSGRDSLKDEIKLRKLEMCMEFPNRRDNGMLFYFCDHYHTAKTKQFEIMESIE